MKHNVHSRTECDGVCEGTGEIYLQNDAGPYGCPVCIVRELLEFLEERKAAWKHGQVGAMMVIGELNFIMDRYRKVEQ